jgi:hypothetical protein
VEWFEYCEKKKLDLVLTVPNALLEMRGGENRDRQPWKTCEYTFFFLFNVVGVTQHFPLLYVET